MNKVSSCLLCGVGGQGTILASKLLAFMAMERGDMVRTAETIGMAQRGGCVVSHVRSGASVDSPMIPLGTADVLIAFEPAEALRCLPYLKPDGVVVVNQKAVQPVTASLTGAGYDEKWVLEQIQSKAYQTVIIDGDAVCEACTSPKVLNIALLAAAACSGMLGFSVEELKTAVKKRLPERFHSVNLQAIDYICSTVMFAPES